ncbi:ABC transporter ATP-binding protein [Oryzobacter sp. R7]|uniref:ABC transporter ATP-binding protein n=1 Tax=Oryzobacter faecalis TaxID=3388656 RepID=UPI00398C8BFE
MAEHAAGDLRLSGLAKSFGDFHAVHPLDLTIDQGSFFALLGPSGCGKTTTLRMIAGLEPPSAGSIHIGDRDITSTRAYQRNVNTVFQSYALFPHMTVLDNVAFGLRRRGDKDARTKAQEALDLVQLGHAGGQRPNQLSGGMQQRVALARAVVNRPDVLLLDEPLGALDLKLRRQMQIELKRIQQEVGLTFIHVTHDQEEAMTMADTVAVMNHGRIEQMGAPEILYDLPRSAFVANFVGQSNMGLGQVVDRAGDDLVAEVGGTRVRVPAARSTRTEGRIFFGVRPEKVRIHENQPVGAGNDLKATVTDVSFTGVATQYQVTTESGATWAVYEQNLDVQPQTVRPGDVVWLGWDPAHAFAVDPDEEAAKEAAEAVG